MFEKIISAIKEAGKLTISLLRESFAMLKQPVSPWWIALGALFFVIIPFDAGALQSLRFPETGAAQEELGIVWVTVGKTVPVVPS